MLRLMILIMVMEALFEEITSGCPEELPYTDDLPLVSESLEGLKGKLEAQKSALEIKGWQQILRRQK